MYLSLPMLLFNFLLNEAKAKDIPMKVLIVDILMDYMKKDKQ